VVHKRRDRASAGYSGFEGAELKPLLGSTGSRRSRSFGFGHSLLLEEHRAGPLREGFKATVGTEAVEGVDLNSADAQRALEEIAAGRGHPAVRGTGASGSSAPGGPEPRYGEVAKGALIGTFVGDALGMPFEGWPADALPATVEMVSARLGRGTYTDDTQMMIALAESLLRCDVVDEEDLAAAFARLYDPRRGYGAGTREVIGLWGHGVSVAEAAGRLFGGQGSLGNGAAMRIAPVAVRFASDRRLLDVQARRSARVTHAHPVGIDGAAVQAAAIAAALRGESILGAARAAARTEELRVRLELVGTLAPSRMDPRQIYAQLGASSSAHESVPAAIYAAVQADGFASAVTFAIRCGGDTDTLGAMSGAMSGAIAGARFGYSAIPRRWLDALEDGQRGRSDVQSLAMELAARPMVGFPSSMAPPS
jgi:poly(ADP-ribose) glycohydrolase ARH3